MLFALNHQYSELHTRAKNVYAHTSEQMMKDTAARTQSYYKKLKKA